MLLVRTKISNNYYELGVRSAKRHVSYNFPTNLHLNSRIGFVYRRSFVRSSVAQSHNIVHVEILAFLYYLAMGLKVGVRVSKLLNICSKLVYVY